MRRICDLQLNFAYQRDKVVMFMPKRVEIVFVDIYGRYCSGPVMYVTSWDKELRKHEGFF